RKAAASQPQVPASQPSTPGLVVFELAGNEWTPIAQLPEISSELPRVDLALIDEVPHVVTFDRDVIEVLHLHRQKWVRDLHVPGMAQAASFALLADGGSPRLWVQQQSGSDLLFSLTQYGENPLELKPTTDIPAKDRAIALFSGSIRMIGRTKDGMIERRYSLDSGKPEGKPTDLALPPVSTVLDIQAVQTLVAIGALLLVMLGWFRQQNATDERRTELKSVTLAPLGRRLAAGLIDASPVILTMLIFMVRDRQYAGASIQSRQLLLLLAYWASSFFYIIFTTLVESLGGRSLGKILLGLRVVTMQGQPASTGALVIRNLLRIFDVSFFFLPLLVVVMFPLRQRAADLAAGTLVVINSSADNQGQDGPRVE
ncbi:MAG TPA: RDD family protein, partial [Tepidisphaeraceae bacterium]|nr:RDD family protein [Tepidisphaeraceae bacterium]